MRNEPLKRKPGRKPDVAHMQDPELVALFSKGYAGMRKGLVDGAHRFEDQDVDGLAAEFLYPGFFGMFSLANTALLVALQKNYNDWLHDYASAANGRLFGLAAIPVQDPDAATAEARSRHQARLQGRLHPLHVSRGAAVLRRRLRTNLGTRRGSRLSALHARWHQHAHVPKGRRVRPWRPDAIADYAATQSAVQRTTVEFMCRGVCERHPNLRLVVAEFNAGWIAHWLDRVDQGLQRERRNMAEPYAGPPPHDIWRRQFHATIEDDRPALATRHLIGVDNLMWGSDYPHTDSTWPCSREVLDELFADVGEEERAKITRGNVAGVVRGVDKVA